MKKRNFHLAFGAVLSFALVLLMLFPNLIFPSRPDSIKEIMDLTETEYVGIVIYGIRMATIISLTVALIRLIIAIATGALAGIGSWLSIKLIGLFESVLKILPSNLVALVILAGYLASDAYRGHFIIFLALVLTIVGWSGPAKDILIEMNRLRHSKLSKGLTAAGKRHLSIDLGNLRRIIRDDLATMFFEQTAKALTLIGQLSIFYVFLQGSALGEKSKDTIAHFLPYWQNKPWLLLYPALAFLIAILTFNLMAEGLRIRRRNLIENPNDKLRFSTKASILCIASALAVLFIYLNIFIPDFSISDMRRTLDFERTGELIPGSDDVNGKAKIIADEMKKMGYSPLFESFIQGYERNESYSPIYDELTIDMSDGKTQYFAGKDYFADSFGNFDVSGKVFDGRRIDYYSFEELSGGFWGNWILLDKRSYTTDDIMTIAEKLLTEYGAGGVLISGDDFSYSRKANGKDLSLKPILSISDELSDELASSNGTLSYKQISKLNDGDGVCVFAELEGLDKERQSTIIIGLSYGWQYEPIKSGKIDFGLEIASQLARRKDRIEQTIVFAFFDSPEDGTDFFAGKMPLQEEEDTLYIDLTGIYEEGPGRAWYGSEADIKEGDLSSLLEQRIGSALNKSKPSLKFKMTEDDLNASLFKQNGIDTISIGFEPCSGGTMDLEDLGNLLVETIIRLGR